MQKMTANDSKSYLGRLNKFVDKHTYHHFTAKKAINVNYSALTEKIETNHKLRKSKVNNRVKTTKYKNMLH